MLNEGAELSEINDDGPILSQVPSGDVRDHPLNLRLNKNLTCEIPITNERSIENSDIHTIGTHACIESESKGMER